MEYQRFVVMLAVAGAGLAGCGAPAGEPTWWGFDTEYYGVPYFNQRAGEFALAQIGAEALDVATAVPTTGEANFSGELGADYSGVYDGSLVATLNMSVDFASGDIDGVATTIVVGDQTHGIAYITPGILTVAGTQSGTGFSADMTGQILINRNTPQPGGDETPMDVAFSVNGDFRDSDGGALPSALTGSGTGSLSGADGDATAEVLLFGLLE